MVSWSFLVVIEVGVEVRELMVWKEGGVGGPGVVWFEPSRGKMAASVELVAFQESNCSCWVGT